MPHPTPSWWPELSLAIWSSLDANSVSREMVEQKVPAPPPIPLPLSPNLWGLPVLPSHDSIVSWQPLYTNKPDYLNVTVACSNLHINLDHYSFLDLARKSSPSSSSALDAELENHIQSFISVAV